MKLRLFTHAMAAIFVASLTTTFAKTDDFGVQVLVVFDYPDATNTLPQKINDKNDIIGVINDINGFTMGFARSGGGHYSDPLIAPNDAANFTEGRGINNIDLMGGDYLGGDGTYHGWFLQNGTYTDYDIQDATLTEVLGINNAGDFVGAYNDSSGVGHGYTNIGGTLNTYTIPNASNSPIYQMNSNGSFCGYYTDTNAITHGFYSLEGGDLVYPVDPAGSAGTIMFGLNDKDWMVGRYADNSGITHGFLFKAPNKFVIFDYPGSTFTSLNGINRYGAIVGRYVDNSGFAHGILARIVRGTTDSAVQPPHGKIISSSNPAAGAPKGNRPAY